MMILLLYDALNTDSCVVNRRQGPTTSIPLNHAEYERDVLCMLHENISNFPITSTKIWQRTTYYEYNLNKGA